MKSIRSLFSKLHRREHGEGEFTVVLYAGGFCIAWLIGSAVLGWIKDTKETRAGYREEVAGKEAIYRGLGSYQVKF